MRRTTWAGDVSAFPEVMFKRVMQPIRRRVVEGEIVTAYTNGQVTLRSNRDKIGYHEAADLSTYQGVEPGDFVVHGLDIMRGSVGISDSRGAISPVCTVCRASDDVDGRFVAYAIRAQAWTGFPKAMARGIREGGADFRRWETLGELPVPCPPLDDQRRIADFLDAETTRIDRLLGLEDQLVGLAAERLVSRREEVLIGGDMRRVPLQHLTDPRRPIVYGIVQAGEEVPDGVPYIKTGDLAGLAGATLSRTSHEIDRAYRRARVRPGDLVMAMRASIGLAVKVPPWLATANLTQGTARIAPALGVDLDWLFHVLRTVDIQDQCQARAVGSTYRTLNIWDLRRIEVPTPSPERMADLGAEVERLTASADQLHALLRLKKERLLERRSALVTAAVTGQVDVATVRGAT